MMNRFKSLFHTYIAGDIHFMEIIKGGSIAFGVKVISAAVVFIFNILLAKYLGVEKVGLYYLAFSVVNIGVMLGRFGTDKAQLRFIAPLASQNDWRGIKNIYRKGNFISFSSSLVMTILIWVFADWISNNIFGKPELVSSLKRFSYVIIPLSLIWNHVEVFKAIKKVFYSVSLQGVLLPLIACILIILWQSELLNDIIFFYVVSCCTVATLAYFLWLRIIRKSIITQTNQSTENVSLLDFVKSAYPLFLASLGAQVLQWTPTFLLGIWGTDANIGEYNIANKIAGLVIFLQFAINTILAPKIGELVKQGEFYEIAALSKKVSFFIILATLPLLLLMTLFPHFLLSIFGNDFEPAANTLRILSIGYVIVLFLPPITLTLMITGNEKSFRNVVLVSALIMVIAGLILVPIIQSVGAAIAFVLACSTQLLVGAFVLHKKLGIITIPDFGYLKEIVRKLKLLN